jgi:hypothetical protein
MHRKTSRFIYWCLFVLASVCSALGNSNPNPNPYTNPNPNPSCLALSRLSCVFPMLTPTLALTLTLILTLTRTRTRTLTLTLTLTLSLLLADHEISLHERCRGAWSNISKRTPMTKYKTKDNGHKTWDDRQKVPWNTARKKTQDTRLRTIDKVVLRNAASHKTTANNNRNGRDYVCSQNATFSHTFSVLSSCVMYYHVLWCLVLSCDVCLDMSYRVLS